jgi:hypothetical protein
MTLTVNHPTLKEATIQAHSPSIGASPIVAYVKAPFRGKIVKLFGVTAGIITTADATVSTAVNGTAITGGNFTITVSGAAAGQVFSAIPSGANLVNEDDAVSFTPSGASGATIPASFGVVFQTA